MTPFSYARATDAADAVTRATVAGTRFLGGGTNLVDLMRETVEAPSGLIDVTGLSHDVLETPEGGLWIGGATRNTALAAHPHLRRHYPAVARAIVAGASPQIRNMATVAGNILQRTRCSYFYDTAGSRCNKHAPGEGCDAVGGFNRGHAILGASAACVAVHPSDMCVALVALDAVVHLESAGGRRSLALADLHRLPGDTPGHETNLLPGELIIAIELPPLPMARRSTYRKARDRASYAFALVSVAAAIQVDAGIVQDVRIALGGVAHRPWRAGVAEQLLRGGPVTRDAFAAAAEAELAAARALRDNGFKIELTRRLIIATLEQLVSTEGAR